MIVIVASNNPVKIAAVRTAFLACMSGPPCEVRGTYADSGVSDQPISDDETREGARNRAMDAKRREPDADYWVGLEGGIATIDDSLQAFAWMAVCDPHGRIGMARSATLPLPPAIKDLVDGGMELGDANDRVFKTVNSKQGGGAFGLLTDGRYTREGIYAQTVALALVPLLHPLFESRHSL
ncbi:MAG: inosine/xanthosine triphosphatase [Woeseia sp.]|nr:inosine/xanthosine triphosphatase [Woeseia sp.]MBT8096799.1 inosine/xanthosine triphosphatase [Woeseia sp.]NNE60399.1 inosine/xanthosine triphosphatase [Woeseia sp.]NNL53796.1 inosine/xanthosine triphosphatase [Woeseia sp.]